MHHTGADPEDVEQFWSSLLSSTPGQEMQREHSFLRGRTPHSLRHTLPLVIHEDAAPYCKGHSVSVISCSSISGMGKELDVKFALAIYILRSLVHVQRLVT